MAAKVMEEVKVEEAKIVEAKVEEVKMEAKAEPKNPQDDDIVLRELAKRRRMVKRSLIGQAFDYALIVLSTFFFIGLHDWDDRIIFGFFLCAFWGLRLAWRWFKFMKPSFKEGMAAYLRKREERQLEFEYNQLKKMSAELVAQEMSR